MLEELCRRPFPEEGGVIDLERVVYALAAYERTLISAASICSCSSSDLTTSRTKSDSIKSAHWRFETSTVITVAMPFVLDT